MLKSLERWWYRKEDKKPEEKDESGMPDYKELIAARERLLKSFNDPGIVHQYPREFDEVGEDV